MITYYSVFLILVTVGVRCQYELKEYAPDHDNYESYSFAYGVSDPISGDHKHQWERMEHGHIRGEYGLMEPDGMMRLVQYTAGPKEGFQATVTKHAVQVAKPEFTHGRELYQQGGEYDRATYAAEDTSASVGINQNQEQITGNSHPEYVQLDYRQKINQENNLEPDYISQESQHHAIITRSPEENRSDILNHRRKDQSSSSSKKKQIVKKNIETELHLLQPGFTAGGTEYISNFNLNPLNIDQLNIPEGERKLLHGLSNQEHHQQRLISASLYNPTPFTLQSIPNLSPIVHPALIKFQKEIGNSNLHGYQFTPHHHALPLIQSNTQRLPNSIQDVKTQQGIDNSYGDKRLQNALTLIHNHPVIKTRLENLHNQYNIPQEQPVIQIANVHQTYQDPRILDGNYQIPIQGSSEYEPNLEGKRYNNENQTTEQKEEERQYLLGLRPLNIPQPTQQFVQNPSDQQYHVQNIPQQGHQTNGNGYGHYQQNHPELNYERTKLNAQKHYPVVLVDPKAKLGLSFYPSLKEIHQIPNQEYNYEDIPLYGPNLEGKRYNNENQTAEEKARERQYLLGLTPGPLFPPPPGYTRETIWQAGDPDADPQPEILVRQLNETCAYIQINETTPGTEDGRANIWQAGDYSAQRQEEELIQSVNITCENYTADAMSNFSSGYTVVDYCWQCVRNDNGEYFSDYNNGFVQPAFVPSNIGPDNEQHQNAYSQNDPNQPQQTGYAHNNANNGQQQIVYVQNDGNNEQQQIAYSQNDGKTGQNQENYETNVENYGHQQIAYIQNDGNNGQQQQIAYGQNDGNNGQQQQIANGQNDGNNGQQHQIAYGQNDGYNGQQQQIAYGQNADNNGQQQIAYVHNDGNNGKQQQQIQKNYETNVENYGHQQIAYGQNDGYNGQQQQIAYGQNADNNGQQQIAYVHNDGNNGKQQQQNQKNYETNVENYGQQQIVNDSPQTYIDNSQVGQNNYQQGQGPMKVVIYPNLGYRNDPQSGEYGLHRRRSTKIQKIENVSGNRKS